MSNDDLLQPSIGLEIWSLFCILLLSLGLISLTYYLLTGKNFLRLFRRNIHAKVLLTIFVSWGFNSCKQETLTLPQPEKTSIGQLVSDYKLEYVSNISSKDDESALHFKNATEAKLFLDELKSHQDDLLSGYEQSFVNAYTKGISSSQKNKIDDYNKVQTTRVTDDGGGNSGNETPPGSGSFSQTYFPWNRISVYAQWDSNHNITNFQSFFTGVAIGTNWNQLGYTTSATLESGAQIIKITYTVSVFIFVEGIGTLWTSEPREAFAVLSGGGFSGSSMFTGSIFNSYTGAFTFASAIVAFK